MKSVQTLDFREVVRCSQCGTAVTEDVGLLSRCAKCGCDLHTCAQCTSFDSGSRFECAEPAVTGRVSPERVHLLQCANHRRAGNHSAQAGQRPEGL